MLRIATIGTSMITDNLIEALNQSDHAVFVGTLSRDAERAAAFTKEHGGSRPFTSLEELAASDEVDAVYIGSPNALHAPQALACIAQGKHVFVEKPFASNRAEAAKVFAAAERAGVVALEAMRPVHDPAFATVRELLSRLGQLRRASIRFGKYSSRYDNILAGEHTNIFDCAMASGSLMDIGVYPVEATVALMGEPESICFAPVLLDESTRDITNGAIDGAGTILARYPGRVVEIAFSKITNDDLPVQFESETATMTLDSISVPSHASISYRGKVERGSAKVMRSQEGGRTEEFNLPTCPNTMTYELEDFIAAVEAVRSGCPAGDAPAGEYGTVGTFRGLTLATLSVMDEARRQAGIVFPADEPAAKQEAAREEACAACQESAGDGAGEGR